MMSDQRKDRRPRVSVLLPCYNAATYLAAALHSLLAQTFADFELIVIDDGSTDDTPAIIASFTDPRLRCYHHANRGLAATLNRGLELVGGDYIARMDADDVSAPERFARQVAYLDAHPECGMVGTWARIIEGECLTSRCHRPPPEDALIKFDLLFYNPLVHSSMMIRREVFDRVGPYATAEQRQPQDYELWSRIMPHYRLANLPELLHDYREVPTSISRSRKRDLTAQLEMLNRANLAWAADRAADDAAVTALAQLARGHRPPVMPPMRELTVLMQAVVARLRGSDEAVNARLAELAMQRLENVRFLHYPYCYGNGPGRLLRLFDTVFRKPGRIREGL
jgi:glycosyltransferase involved in cell wall biosynthesis